jgi:hypothetical protein
MSQALELLCEYKKRWFLSFVIVAWIIYFVLISLEVPDKIIMGVGFVHLLIHIFIVKIYKTTECEDFKLEKEKNRCYNLLNIPKPLK